MAVVQVNENTLDFIFDSNTNFYNKVPQEVLVIFGNKTEIYYYNENDTLVNTNYSYQDEDGLILYTDEFDNIFELGLITLVDINFVKYSKGFIEDEIKIEKNQWYVVLNNYNNIIKCKGIRIINFEYYDNQNLDTINTLVNPYIGTKTSFAKTYTLRVNGKTLNTINGKKIRNLIYNGTTYEIAEPVAAEYSLTFENTSGPKFPSDLELPKSIKAGQTIDINWYTLWKPGPFFKIEGINCNARWFTTTDEFNNNYFHIEVSNATGDAVVKMYDDDILI